MRPLPFLPLVRRHRPVALAAVLAARQAVLGVVQLAVGVVRAGGRAVLAGGVWKGIEMLNEVLNCRSNVIVLWRA